MYYIYDFDFGNVPRKPEPEMMPNDVKRLIHYREHTFANRFYFVSERERMIYRFYVPEEYHPRPSERSWDKLYPGIYYKPRVQPNENFDQQIVNSWLRATMPDLVVSAFKQAGIFKVEISKDTYIAKADIKKLSWQEELIMLRVKMKLLVVKLFQTKVVKT